MIDSKKYSLVEAILMIKELPILPAKKAKIVQKVLLAAGEEGKLMDANYLANKLPESGVKGFFNPSAVEDVGCFNFIKHPADNRYHLATSINGIWMIESPEEGEPFKYQPCWKADSDETALYYLMTKGNPSKKVAQEICDKFNLPLSPVLQDENGYDYWTVAITTYNLQVIDQSSGYPVNDARGGSFCTKAEAEEYMKNTPLEIGLDWDCQIS